MKKNPIKSDLRETTAGKVTFLFLLFLYTGVMLYLFWMECYQVPGFQSDMPDYVNKVAGIAGNYEFPYPILFWTARLSAWLIGAKAAMAVTTALFNLAAVIITKYYMNREMRKNSHYETLSHKKQVMTDIVVTLLVFALFLLSNLYSPKNTAFFGFDYAYRAYIPRKSSHASCGSPFHRRLRTSRLLQYNLTTQTSNTCSVLYFSDQTADSGKGHQ